MKIGEDGFFVVEKDTNNVRCWCRVDKVKTIDTSLINKIAEGLSKDLCVTPQYVIDYACSGKNVCLWEIGKVAEFQGLIRSYLLASKNPQQFAYCRFK